MNYLVPVDFSQHSKNAAEFAASLTRVWPGNVQLAHIMVPNEEESAYVATKTIHVKQNTVFEVCSLQEHLRRNFNVRTGVEMVSGRFVSKVLKTAAHQKSDLIVVGTQGISGLRPYLYGSHTMELIEQSTLPVLAVPSDTTFKPFRHIVYVTEFTGSDQADIVALGKIASKFKALLSVISINSPVDEDAKAVFRTSVKEQIPFAAVHFEDRQNPQGAAEGLLEFSLQESVDLIGLAGSNKDLVRCIAGRSLTTEFAFEADIPVLFFPSH
jgi:nucleotide-binding universal stress UspA family protein